MNDVDRHLDISEAAARRADANAVNTLLQELPQSIAQDLRAQLARTREGFCAMRYHHETSRAFWIAADTQRLLCVSLPALTEAQAAQVWEKIEARQCSGDSNGVMNVYSEVTGSSLQPIIRN